MSSNVVGANALHSGLVGPAVNSDRGHRFDTPSKTETPPAALPSSPPVLEKTSANQDTHLTNGNTSADVDNDQNESEAETEILSEKESSDTKKRSRMIKTERSDGEEISCIPSAKSNSRSDATESGAMSPTKSNGSSEAKDIKRNGTSSNGHGNGNAKHTSSLSGRASSTSSRAQSWQGTDSSPREKAQSPAPTARSPGQSSTHARSASTVESRKRKHRESENNFRDVGPPRQRHKTEDPDKDYIHRLPHSPDTPGIRSHRRSASTQSALQGAHGRKRREAATVEPHGRRNWGSESDSDDVSTPNSRPGLDGRIHSTPSLNLQSMPRLKRSQHRSLTSPARALPKKNVDQYGTTKFARECERGDLDTVKAAYLQAPNELDQEDFSGITPLQKASLKGHADIVKFLIEKGCNTNCKDKVEGDTPLIDAVENSHLDVVKLLLWKGHVDPLHARKDGSTALDLVDEDETEMREELERACEKMKSEIGESGTNNNGESLSKPSQQVTTSSRLYYEFDIKTLRNKAAIGDLKMVADVVESGVTPDFDSGFNAARGNHDDVLNLLLAYGLEPDPNPAKHEDTPMTIAIKRGYTKIIELLICRDDFDPTRQIDGRTYFEFAEHRKGPKWQQVKEMLEKRYREYVAKHGKPKGTKRREPPTSRRTTHEQNEKVARSKQVADVDPPKARKKLTPAKQMSSEEIEAKQRRLSSNHTDVTQRRRRIVSSDSEGDDSGPSSSPKVKVRKRLVNHRTSNSTLDRKTSPELRKSSPVARKTSPLERKSSPRDPSRERTAKEHRLSSSSDKIKQFSPDLAKESRRAELDAKRQTEEKAKRLAEAKAKREAEEKIKREAEEKEAEENQRRAEEKAIRLAEEQEKREAERKRQEAEKAKREAGEAKQREAEERKKREEEERAQREAEEKSRREAEEKAKREAEEKAKREAEEEKRRAEEAAKREAEALARQREEEEARLKAEAEEAERKRLADLEAQKAAARKAEERKNLLASLPPALSRALELGPKQSLYFIDDEPGIYDNFLPVHLIPRHEIEPDCPKWKRNDQYMLSHQAIGILGLYDMDLEEEPYKYWERLPVPLGQRDILLNTYDVAQLARDTIWDYNTPEADEYAERKTDEAREKFRRMEPLWWIKWADFEKVAKQEERLKDFDILTTDCSHVVEHVKSMED